MPTRISREPIGDRIRQLREKRGWSLTELAEQANVSRSYISQIESGKSTPTQEKILQFSEDFGVLPSELLGESTEQKNIPVSLKQFAEAINLPPTDIQMLAQIQYRGKRPDTVEEWRAIYSVIKGMLENQQTKRR